jgi:hypothetical protein
MQNTINRRCTLYSTHLEYMIPYIAISSVLLWKNPRYFICLWVFTQKFLKDCFAFQSQVLDHYPCMFLGMDKHRRSWKNENVQPEPKMNDMFRAS